jgi:hypothetical protein
MTRSRRIQIQAMSVLSLGLFAFVGAPPLASESADPICYETCSEAMFETYCDFPAYSQCRWEPFECEGGFIGYCVFDS